MSTGSLSADEFASLHTWLSEQARRVDTGRRPGALNHITPAEIVAAAAEVRLGRTVSLASPIADEATADNPEPAVHRMTSESGADMGDEGLHFALDRLTMNIHGNADTHLDALCHVVYQGRLHNDVPASAIGTDGAEALSVDVARDGIVGRGVLLDIPRLRGVPWLEPGDHVTADELLAAEREQHVRVGRGDLLLVRVGHRKRRDELGPWDAATTRAGLDPRAVRFLAERQVAVLGSDSNNDTAPSDTPGVAFPVHVLAVQALGLHLLDYLQLEELLPLCERHDRWTFLCVVAPLRVPGATGSPVNPIAML
jgi:kynurenine formamidase